MYIYITKICNKCKTEKSTKYFSKKTSNEDGLQYTCKSCVREYNLVHYKENKSQLSQYHQNSEHLKAKYKVYYQENKLKISERKHNYLQRNKSSFNLRNAKRRAKKLQATPLWSNDEFEKFVTNEIYELCALRSILTGLQYHVDHIVPLQSDIVCGLHCLSNLRIIPASENLSKNNHHWPDMP
jgi:hypothetical protein